MFEAIDFLCKFAFAVLCLTYIAKMLFKGEGVNQREIPDPNRDIEWETKEAQYVNAKNDLRQYVKRDRGVSNNVIESIERLADKEKAIKDILRSYNFKEKEDYEKIKRHADWVDGIQTHGSHFRESFKSRYEKEIYGKDETAQKSKIDILEAAMIRKAQSIYENELRAAQHLVNSKRPLTAQEKEDAKKKADFIRNYRSENVTVVHEVEQDTEEQARLHIEAIERYKKDDETQYEKNIANLFIISVILLLLLFIYLQICH
jgi:hypothetical protein